MQGIQNLKDLKKKPTCNITVLALLIDPLLVMEIQMQRLYFLYHFT